ncbi:uncharacterized protein [Amphiura filiformis]|uniref:uncharacterized protein isoform X1 n=1 Tax=Amphiura filiformis TaxID=82378 RepID=UPI003B20B9C4
MNINRSFSGLRLLLFLILTSIATIHSLNITSVPPDESNPRCSYSSNQIPLNIMSIADTVTVEFTCEMAGGNPLPNLTWYKGATQELSTATSPNKFIYELSAYDNGIPFTCEASGPALQEIRSCVPGVTPLRVRPSVEISSSSSPVVENSSVIFTCEGSGLPYISQIYWSYNGKPVSNDSFPLSFKIVNNISDGFSSSSKLHLFSLQLDNNNDLVTCFVESPSFLSSQAIVTVSVIRVGTQTATPTQQTLSLTSVTNEQNMSPSQVPRDIIVGLSVSAVVIEILIILVIFTHRRYRHRFAVNNQINFNPTRSETQSTTNWINETHDYQDVPNETPDYQNVPNETHDYQDVPNETPDYQNVPNETPDYQNVPSVYEQEPYMGLDVTSRQTGSENPGNSDYTTPDVSPPRI